MREAMFAAPAVAIPMPRAAGAMSAGIRRRGIGPT